MFKPEISEFKRLSEKGTKFVPVFREFLLGQYEKIRDNFYAEPLAKFRPKNGDPKNFFDFFRKST